MGSPVSLLSGDCRMSNICINRYIICQHCLEEHIIFFNDLPNSFMRINWLYEVENMTVQATGVKKASNITRIPVIHNTEHWQQY